LATIEPILPQPMMPKVFDASSTPTKRDFSHLPARVDRSAAGSWRARAIIMAMLCSAVVTELPKGVFMTTTPASVAASMSTLSTPIPARPTTLSLVAALSMSAVTLVVERIARPSYSPMMAFCSSGESPGLTSTVRPRSSKMATAAGLSLSAISTRNMGSP
jgi:hypothetical protein